MKDDSQHNQDPNVPTLEELEWTRQWAAKQEERALQPNASPMTICLARAAKRTLASMEEDYQRGHCVIQLFENHAVGHALERIAEGANPVYSVAYFYGDQNKLSKRMEMLASDYAKQHPGAKVLCISARDFIEGAVRSVKYGITDSHPICFRDCDFLIMKDFEVFGGKEAMMQEAYYILDHRLISQKPFVICADRQPNAIPGLWDRLLTILEGGLIYQY